MIQHLQLKNWRAYDSLDLELGPGATFVVASNGRGKTSLIMGAAWGIFGEASRVEATEQIRGDAEEASVEVILRLPSGVPLTITRSIDRRARTRLQATLEDRIITTQGELNSLLSAEYGADMHVLAQLTFMIHGGSLEATHGEFQLQDHLGGVFGVTPLFEAANAAETIASETASALRKLKTAQRSEERQKDRLVADLQSVKQRLTEIHEEREQVVARMNGVADRVRLAEEWVRFRAATKERETKIASIAERATSVLKRSVTADTLLNALTQAEGNLEEAISRSENEGAVARGKTDLIDAALSRLRDAQGICPTCLRPLSEHEAESAEREHRRHLQELTAVMGAARDSVGQTRAALNEVRQVLMQIRSLPTPVEPDPQAANTDLESAREEFLRARDEVQHLDQTIAEHATSRRSLEDALGALDEDELRIHELEALFRQEGLARAAAESFRETGKAITKEFIEPLVGEVAMRWKRIFGSGGLSLSPTGEITRQVGSRVLSFESLSGGEKVWALLLTRVLIAGASTRTPFAWLDEPLEHLDPRLRKVVAGTLAKASAGAGLRQVLVTTYESELARQLMEDVPSASLIYVTTSE
ncbi:MAG: AAA family ATPase [Actinomycetota bacterium]